MSPSRFLADLPAAARAALNRRSTGAGLWHLAGHLGALGGSSVLIAAGVPLWGLLVPVQGVLLVFLFTLEHECTHRTPFAHDGLGDAIGRACGLVLILPFTWFRYFHLAHHRFTNVPGDPELAAPKPETRAQWLWHVSGLLYWGAALALLVRLALGREAPTFLPQRARARATFEARGMVALYALVLASLAVSDLALWLWLVPMLVGQPFLRLYLLAEHGDCPQVADLFANTRTTFTTALIRFVAWNMPYHTEHHVAPHVPFHQLPALHRLMRSRLQVTAAGYSAFTRAYLARRR